MKALLKYLGLALVTMTLSLTSCSSSILHKDGMREAVTMPIVKSIENNETVKKLGELSDSIKTVADKVKDSLEESNKQSIVWKAAPLVVVGLSILLAGLIIVKAIKKK